MSPAPLRRLLAAGVTTGIFDGLFATASALLFGNTVVRLWQGVAFTVVGQRAFEGGGRTVLLGLLMHFGVAFGWSAVFLALYETVAPLRRLTSTRGGVVGVAAVYGPAIWMVMSLVVIPVLIHRQPAFTARWWVQLVGHFPFVGLPIVSSIARRTEDGLSDSRAPA